MVPKCNACGKFMPAADRATCTKCSGMCHRACVNIPQGTPVPASWMCPDCKASLPRANADCTPIKGQSLTLTPTATEPTPEVPDIYLDLSKFREEMRLASEECKIWREEVAEMRSIMKSMAQRIETLENRVDGLEKNSALGFEGGAYKELEAAVSQLKIDLNERDQELLLNDVDIAGIPEEENESVQHLVLACATKLGVPLEERDIVSCRRVGMRKAEVQDARPRAVTVRLARRSLRDQIIKAARVRRGINTDGLGLRAPLRPLYVNERLTRTNRQLFNRAREMAKKFGWRFVWTREGHVFARQDHGAPAARIRSLADIESFWERSGLFVVY
ncbi:hypothetical protein ABMA28_010216 [Loxostege sticticalis]|uniref:FP protein C-terminal domain-containing protein n=1 Tax=Loxostege sticticalis TaxID=481309 RepID=A0ABD0SAM3_LOXSC